MLTRDIAMSADGHEATASADQPADGSGPPPEHRHIWLVTGPAVCGKTTVAEHLALALGMPYLEGDAFHTAANVDKMRSGNPLTDADRWDWLTHLRDESMRLVGAGAEGVVTCSALKRKYRNVIRVAAYYDRAVLIHFIFLHAPADVLLQRVTSRQGHYMGPNMVQSQLSILELPGEMEKDIISIDVVKQEALALVSTITRATGRMNRPSGRT